MPAIGLDTIPGIACFDNTGHACIETGGCHVLRGCCFCSYGMEYKKCTDIAWCQYPSPLTLGSLGTCYNVTIPNLDANTCYQYHAIGCTTSNAYSGTTLSIYAPLYYPWVTAPLLPGPVPLPGTSYNFTINSLTANTIYEYRAYMVVCGVPYCGNIYTGATCATPVFAPTVTTSGINTISCTTASGGGNVTSDGGAPPVTARGTAWSTTANPTIADCHTSDGTGTGSFVSSLSGLLPNTTYNVRAYATNCVNTSYGSNCSFITLSPPPPLTIFVEICTDVLNFCIEGAAFLRCCDGSSYRTLVVGTPTTNSCSCVFTGIPAGCYYVDYSGIHLWYNHAQQSDNGVNWSDNTSSGYDEICTHCFNTNNSVYGCIY